MIKTILLTGSGGFVGKNLKKYLEREFNILSPRSYELNCVNKTAVEKYFEENEIDFIIHCASTGGVRGMQDKDTTLEDNLKMVENLLDAKGKNVRIILFGSGAMYGKTRPLHKVKEKELGLFTPEDLYGKSKMLIAEMIKNRSDAVCLNIFACYGYDEKESRFPTYAIKRNLNHLPIEINQNVDFDYLFIEDLCKFVRYFVGKQPKNNIINVTPTDSIKLSEIANIVNQISDFKSDIILKNNLLGNEYTGSNELLLSEISDFQFTSYKLGLEKLYNYIKTNCL